MEAMNAQEALAVLGQVVGEHESLRAVASSAAAVPDSECGVASLGELARAVKAAGWGDWTAHNPYITEEA